MEKKLKIAIILEYGFHDLKKFIFSDFGKKMSERYDIIWLAIQKESKEFDTLFSSTGFPIYYFNQQDFRDLTKLESRNLTARRSWMLNQNVGVFNNYKRVSFRFIKKKVLGNNFVVRFLEKVTLNRVNKRYQDLSIVEFFIKNGVSLLLGTGYVSSFSKTLFVSANRANVKTFLLVNNWKDLFQNNFIPFNFLHKVFVWDEKMKKDYLFHMPYLNVDQLEVTGNPVFDNLRKSQPTKDRGYYAKKYNINENAGWIYYTMASPFLLEDEINTIILVGNELLKNFSSNEFVILVRMNPQHQKYSLSNLEFPENVVLTESYCFFDIELDMNIQTPEGEEEWIDLLHYCNFNFSIPSTVTLEFLVLNKPVLNIGFGPNGKEDARIKHYFESGFYKPVFEKDLVKKVLDILNLNESFVKLIESTNNDESKDEMSHLASDIIFEIMERP